MENKKISGIGGFLMVFFVLSIIYTILILSGLIEQAVFLDQIDAVLFLNVLNIMLIIRILFLIISKHRKALLWIIYLIWISFLIVVTIQFISGVSGIFNISIVLIWTLVWFFYFKVSKRVRNTFIR